MALKTPAWWYKRNAQGAPWWRFALWPLSRLWLFVNAIKASSATPYRSSLKVISIGNVSLGGSGKTPIAAEVMRLLGQGATGLSRGHGGALPGPVRVDTTRHTAAEVGDEPLMLAQHHAFWVARDRADGLRAIAATDATTVVVDDAHQNLTITKDVHILVVDGDTKDGAWPFGDGGICPYGPLREPLLTGLARSDIVVVWLPDNAPPSTDLIAHFAEKPVFVARLHADKSQIMQHVIGFAGIAKPWKFESTLLNAGFEVVEFHAFPDHVSPTENQLQALAAKADAQLSHLITTEKDWVRLPQAWRDRVRYLPIRARFDDEASFLVTLKAILHRDRSDA